jgi:multiple sugar transport system permease protein
MKNKAMQFIDFDKKAITYILPALLAMMFVHVIPIVLGIFVSFLDLDIKTLTQLFRAPFVGLNNFATVFNNQLDTGQKFVRSIFNILAFGFFTISIDMILAISIALLLNKKFVGRTFVRGIILLPYITPDSVMYNVWRFIFQTRIGILNRYLLGFGIILEPISWLVGDNALTAVIFASIWKGWSYACLVYLAALQTIPKELYEAARIDGATRWQQFKSITFPLLWPTTRTLLIISIIWNFHTFNSFYVMLGGDTSANAAIPALVILREGFTNLHYGLGSAMAVILLLIIFAMTFFAILKRKREI